MSDTPLNDSIKQHLRDILQGISSRAEAEKRLESESAEAPDLSDAEFQQAVAQVENQYATARSAAELKHQTERNEVLAAFDADHLETDSEYKRVLTEIDREYEKSVEQANREQEDAQWMVSSVLDDQSEESPKLQLDRLKKQLQGTKERLETERRAVEQETDQTLDRLGLRSQWEGLAAPDPIKPTRDRVEAMERFETALVEAKESIAGLQKQKLARIATAMNLFIIFLVLGGALFGLGFALIDPAALQLEFASDPVMWYGSLAGVGFGLAFVFVMILFAMARSRSGRMLRSIAQAIAEMRGTHKLWMMGAKKELQQQQVDFKKRYGSIVAQREGAIEQINTTAQQKLQAAEQKKQSAKAQAEATYPPRLQQLAADRDQRLQAIDATFGAEMQQIDATRSAELETLNQRHLHSHAQRQAALEKRRGEMTENWQTTTSRFSQAVESLQSKSDELTPAWQRLLDEGWTLPSEIPQGIRFGAYQFNLEQVDKGLPADDALRPEQSKFELPAMLPFPGHPSLLFKARGEGRRVAVESICTVMLRLLSSLPAGKVKFTIIDPVGLGENFSAFMHLADFDEMMVGTRIWTETSQIEKRLTELTEHMENIFQVYLRNEFETIEEYNRQAGEVAEPYNFLVVANFPVNFNEASARRLASICTSGPRCGVYTLISIDANQTAPHGFDPADLEENSTVLAWDKGSFFNTDSELSAMPMRLESPPQPEVFTNVVRSIGEQSKDMRRVEVPFERIAPSKDRIWTKDSRSDIDVPLGPAGATKLQHLNLGHGTSQHVLVAGKTGSGKSSFLHAMITNIALHYSPDEVEFFLIDFKKGVEFKTYANYELPHARVIGIESDREFGVSILERLDDILKERGELFRRNGVQDIAGFRKSQPNTRMPRIMLIIDEFQEFFVEDDQLSQAATLLLDRMVRQGRAFGIHVLLGSQTLGGAYSLARSTLGQVAVRIALQCSDADAHLILSEENTAARLLTRPGEAIYNDANGLVEGNHPFQVAWLGDERRERYLSDIRDVTRERNVVMENPIVFEGHIASDMRRNARLLELLEKYDAGTVAMPDGQTGLEAWLGEAVSIKPPTQIAFRGHSGENLLIVGQEPDSAEGLLTAITVALASQQPPRPKRATMPPQFTMLDGELTKPEDSTHVAQLAGMLQHSTAVGGPNDAAALVGEVFAEVDRRNEGQSSTAEPIFLVISNLGRFRDLRKDEDDFGFGGMGDGKPESASKQLSAILKDGPSVGVHAIIWCDSCGNMNRWFGMQTVREFEMRVAFRMNANDSSSLLDSPVASRLGVHRALLYHGEQGTIEKFRPYRTPEKDFLDWIAEQLQKGEVPEPPEPEPAAAADENDRAGSPGEHSDEARDAKTGSMRGDADDDGADASATSESKPSEANDSDDDAEPREDDIESFTIN